MISENDLAIVLCVVAFDFKFQMFAINDLIKLSNGFDSIAELNILYTVFTVIYSVGLH